MKKVFMVMYNLNRGAGSTRVMMNRSRGLVERGYGVTIATFKNSDVKREIKRAKKMGRLDKRVNVLNIYKYFQYKNTRTKITEEQKEYYKSSVELYEQNYQVQLNQSRRYANYYYNGEYVKSKKWKKNGDLNYIEHYKGAERIRKIFHRRGNIKRKEYYESADDTMKYIEYFTRDGFCFLERRFNKNKNTVEHILFDRDSSKEIDFISDEAFQAYWLEQLCKGYDHKPYIICDKKECAHGVMNMKKGVAHQIYVIHKNHLKYPFKIGSPKRAYEEFILKNLPILECVVMLTHKQKQDVIKEFGDYGNKYVIPNSVHESSVEKVKKEDQTVSLVARLDPAKQIDHAIDAFKKVTQKFPNAKLEIYGIGNHKKALRQQIEDLQLNQNVFLRGYAENTDTVYQRSIVTLLPTQTEAFAMVIPESMVNGTPVISYDINYGPSDIITHGKDGYLIKQDKKTLASKIIKLLKKPKKAQKMGEKAKENTILRFHERTVIDQWVQLLEHLGK